MVCNKSSILLPFLMLAALYLIQKILRHKSLTFVSSLPYLNHDTIDILSEGKNKNAYA